jgi:hypothetical protein
MARRQITPSFESLWNRDHIDSVQISVFEELGVGKRTGYYDKAGALRDKVQNHLTQLLTLLAMEVPPVIGADSVRYEKVKVLRSMAPILPGDVTFGQYSKGEIRGQPVPGYLEENGVALGSTTETFAALFIGFWTMPPPLNLTGATLLNPHRSVDIGTKVRPLARKLLGQLRDVLPPGTARQPTRFPLDCGFHQTRR